MIYPMIARLFPPSRTVRYAKEAQFALARRCHSVAYFASHSAGSPSGKKSLPQSFRFERNSQQNTPSWMALFGVACVAAVLTSHAEEEANPALSWDEVTLVANLFGVTLPETRDAETLRKATHRCFYAVFQACLRGEWDLIGRVPVETLSKLTDTWGQSLLIAAAREGNKAVVDRLIRMKVALHRVDYEGNTPLHAAAKNGFDALVPSLWVLYIQTPNREGKTAYHVAIAYGHVAFLKALIAQRPLAAPVKIGDLSLSLPEFCIKEGQMDCLTFVLSQPSYKVESKSAAFGTLLHAAVHFAQFGILKSLVERREAASLLTEQDPEGRNPLDLAAFLGDVEAVKFLYSKLGDTKSRDDWTPVHWAVKGKQPETLQVLAALGANLEAKNKEGKKPKALLKGDTSPEAAQIRTILGSTLDSRAVLASSAIDRNQEPVEGIVFKGGGPRGLAYLEALRALQDAHALGDVKRVAGTSAGAITAAIFALDPELTDTALLEALDLMTFLDPVPGKKPLLDGALKAKDKDTLLSKICAGSLEMAKEVCDPFKFYNAFSQLEGLCEGEVLRKWIEGEISRRTGIPNCTFGELKTAIAQEKQGKRYLHLHVYAMRLQEDPSIPRILHFSSEDPEWENIVIADAIRASMSIPGVFVPYTIREKTRSGTLIPRTDIGPCVDGGLVKNFPLDAFDGPKPGERYSSFNRRTLGLCLKDVPTAAPPVNTRPVSGILDVAKACASVYWSVEELYLQEKAENQHRTIEIPIQGVGLLDFNLTNEQKASLRQSGRESIENAGSPFSRENGGDLAHRKVTNIVDKFPDFVGRQPEIRKLEESFVSRAIRSPKQTVVRLIHGLGGMGKTELARAFARDHSKDFSLIWFIHSATVEQKHQSYRALADELKLEVRPDEPPEEIERRVHARLKEHSQSKPWLLIYDNVEQRFTPPQGGYVIMTSRHRDIWDNPEEQIQLDAFSPEEGVKILSGITKKTSPRMGELARELGHFPLALNQAAHYIRKAGCTIEDYLAAVRKNPLKAKMSVDERYHHTVQTVWQITLQNLEKEHPKAFAWLKICAYLNPDQIPQSWIPDWLAMQPGGADDWDQIEITKALEDLSLLKSENGKYTMHRLLQQVVIESQGGQAGFEAAVEVVEQSHHEEEQLISNLEEDLIHATHIEQSRFFQNLAPSKQVQILRQISSLLTIFGRGREALPHLQRALRIGENISPPDPLALAECYESAGDCFRSLALYKESLEYCKKALEIRKEWLPSNDPVLAKSYFEVANNFQALESYQEALECNQKALELLEKILPAYSPELALYYAQIGYSLAHLGRREEALGCMQKGLAITSAAALNNTSAISVTSLFYSTMAATARRLELYSEYLGYLQKSLTLQKQFLPPNHPDLVLLYVHIADGFNALGRRKEVLDHLEKALELICSREIDVDPRISFVDIFSEYIICLDQCPDKAAREQSKQKILVLYTPILGKDHPQIKALQKAGPKGWWPF